MDALVRPFSTQNHSDEGVQVTFFNRLLTRSPPKRGARGQESTLGITGPTKVGREFQGGDMLAKQVEQLQPRCDQTP